MTDDQKPIPRRLRFEILRRDGHTCRYCGAQAPDVPLAVDHVIPRVLGGSDDPSNLVTACRDCNLGKASIAPDAAIVADVDATSFLFAKALERAAAERLRQRREVNDVLAAFDETWCSYKDPPRPYDWAGSIERLYGAGLSIDDLRDFTAVAMSGPAAWGQIWRYFCGCCWRDLTERQELARQLIEDGKV
jgi:5-methylcytosine-specific restriction endonuclease McrA